MVVLEKKKLTSYTVKTNTVYLYNEFGRYLGFLLTNKNVGSSVLYDNNVYTIELLKDTSYKATLKEPALKKLVLKNNYLNAIIKKLDKEIYKETKTI